MCFSTLACGGSGESLKRKKGGKPRVEVSVRECASVSAGMPAPQAGGEDECRHHIGIFFRPVNSSEAILLLAFCRAGVLGRGTWPTQERTSPTVESVWDSRAAPILVKWRGAKLLLTIRYKTMSIFEPNFRYHASTIFPNSGDHF